MSTDNRLADIAEIVRNAPPLPASSPAEPQAEQLDGVEENDEAEPGELPDDPEASAEVVAYCAGLEQNDTDNGERLRRHFGDNLLHVREVGWHIWGGSRWQREGGDDAVRRYAQRTAKRIHLEADCLSALPYEVEIMRQAKPLRDRDPAELTPEDRDLIDDADRARKALGARRIARRKFATTCGNAGRVSAMISEALPHSSIGPHDLDADLRLFNTENGTLRLTRVEDLENVGDYVPNYCLSVELVPHDRAHRITKIAAVAYDPQAKCPKWDAFLERFQPDPEIREFLQIYHGLALIGDISQQCFIYNHGNGANGKSTFMEALAELFGSYGDMLNAESISGQGQRRGDQATPDFAELPGIRYLRVSELPRGEQLREQLIKTLTGGEGMKVRHLNKGFFDLKTVFLASMSGNDTPQIGGLDEGIWRRVKLTPWAVTIPFAERRPMKEILAEFALERAGILNWLLAGLDLFYRKGLKTPRAVQEATDSYREDLDPIGAFAGACLVKEPGHDETARDVYEAFVSWCEANSIRPWKETMFGKVLPSKGYPRDKGRVRKYLNVRLDGVPPRRSTRNPSTDAADAP